MRLLFSAFSLVLLIIALTSCSVDAAPDWNDDNLNWYSYEEGLEELKKGEKNGIFIIYADWCSTCKQYSTLFSNLDVAAALEDVILIRSNIDLEPEISEAFDLDGVYVPRTFALNNRGNIIKNLTPKSPKWQYFLPSDDKDFLIEFSGRVKKHAANNK